MNELVVKEKKRNDVELNQDEIMSLIDQLPKNSNVTLTGGEVFLKKGIEEIIEKTAAKHHVTIATNGLLLSKHSEIVVKSGVEAIGVSLDGPPDVHNRIRNVPNAYEKLEESLRVLRLKKEKLKLTNPKINVNSVILTDNYDRLEKTVSFFKKNGISSCTFQILDLSLNRSGINLNGNKNFCQNPLVHIDKINPILMKKALDNIIEQGKKQSVDIRFLPQLTIDEITQYYQGTFDLTNWECNLPWNTMRVSPYGDVYPCMNLFIGNVRQNKLSTLWNNQTYTKFRQSLKHASLFPSCIGCCKMKRKKSK
jgi:radical SAM protein with 4Fe4S-binding SPASM domain